MESILQSSLLADMVAEEQRKAQLRPRRKSADSDCPVHKLAEPAPALATELRLREQVLRDREKALKEREERLERECFTPMSSAPTKASPPHLNRVKVCCRQTTIRLLAANQHKPLVWCISQPNLYKSAKFIQICLTLRINGY